MPVLGFLVRLTPGLRVLPAERMAAATAWSRGWPDLIISAMFEDTTAWDEPFARGIDFSPSVV